MYKKIIGLIVLSCIPIIVFSTHFMGVDLSYECIGSCTYRFYHRTYYDCTGGATIPLGGIPPAPSQTDFSITGANSGNCAAPIQTSAWQFVSYTEVTPVCAAYPTACTGAGVLNGVLEAVYYVDYDFCAVNCSTYTVSFESCCRNYTINSGASGAGIYLSFDLNTGLTPCNSGPQFASPAAVYVCAGQSFIFDLQGSDPDGDSLVYSLGPCYSNMGIQVPYTMGFSPIDPLGPSWDISIDATTGEIYFDPDSTGGAIVTGIMCVYIQEYQGGVLVGEHSRDMQVTTFPCTNGAVQVGNIQNLIGAQQVGAYDIAVCPGMPFSFEVPITDSDPGDSLSVSVDWGTIQGGVLTVTGTNPLTAQIDFTAGITNWGSQSFTLTASDDACPISSEEIVTFNIWPDGLYLASNIVHTNCQSNLGEIHVTAFGGTPPYFYQWNHGPTTPSLTGLPMGVYTVSVTDASGTCGAIETYIVEADNITLQLQETPPTCAGNDGEITAVVTGGAAPYTYQWNTGDTTSTISNLIPGGYSVLVTDTLGCLSQEVLILEADDSCFVTISGTVYVDQNQNCIQDSNEVVLPYAYVDIGPGGAVIADSNGYYSFQVDTGQYVISANFFHPAYQVVCPTGNFYLLHPTLYGTHLSGNDFGVFVIPVQDLRVSMAAGVARWGFQQTHSVSYYNDGTTTVNATVSWTHDSIMSFVSSVPPPVTYDPLTYTAQWDVPMFAPTDHGDIQITTYIDTTVAVGAQTVMSALIEPLPTDIMPMNNSVQATRTVTNAYDPNDKQVSPEGLGEEGYIHRSEDLMHYTIRFQNTGTDTAIYVVIRDVIDPHLDITSFMPGTSSHPYTVTVDGDTTLVFTFANIMLPDSSVNYLGSQGHVSFYLKHADHLELGTEILNTAAIYFDFNAPIITNTVINTLFEYPALEVSQDTTICEGGTAILSASTHYGIPPYYFVWSTGDTIAGDQSSVNVGGGGQYQVSVVDQYGFTNQDAITVNEIPIPIANFYTIDNGFELTFHSNSVGGTTWQWDFGDGTTGGGRSIVHTYMEEGTYEIVLIVSNECGADTLIQTVTVGGSLSIEKELKQYFSIYPNPFQDRLIVSWNQPALSIKHIRLLDIQGKEVQLHTSFSGNQLEITRENMASGLYFLEIQVENRNLLYKVQLNE